MKKIRTVLLVTLAAAVSAFGHHSIALFDSTRTITIKGTVKEFQWLNPHALLWVNVESESGTASQLWAVEMTSPGVLTRNGWSKRTFNPGEKVSVEIGPLRDGKPGGLFKKAVFVDTGKVLTYTMQPALKPDSQ